MLFVRGATIANPLEAKESFRTYYAYYDALPKTAAGNLLPMDGRTFSHLYYRPRTFGDAADYEQSPGTFFKWLIILLGTYAAGFGYLIYKGAYWLFVPLPLKIRFDRARAEGQWPQPDEIRDAVREGATNKTSWQSKMMELKAGAFKDELEGLMSKLRTAKHG